MKKNFLTFFIVFIFSLMLIFPDITKNAATEGLNLWIFTVLPALLPYTVISSVLLKLNAFKYPCIFISKLLHISISEHNLLPAVCGSLCGCPTGAKITADIYKANKLPRSRAQFLLCAFNNISPSFLFNYVYMIINSSIIHLSAYDKWIILIIIVFSSVISALFICNHFFISITERFTTPKKHLKAPNLSDTKTTSNNTNAKNKITNSKSFFMNIFDDCILTSLEIQSKIGGYIIMCSIITQLILYTLNLSLTESSIISSILELTGGLSLFTSISDNTLTSNISVSTGLLISLTTFGGLCTVLQTKTVISDTDLSVSKYIFSKLSAGILAFLLTYTYMSTKN